MVFNKTAMIFSFFKYIEKGIEFLASTNSPNLVTVLKTAHENFKINFQQALAFLSAKTVLHPSYLNLTMISGLFLEWFGIFQNMGFLNFS